MIGLILFGINHSYGNDHRNHWSALVMLSFTRCGQNDNMFLIQLLEVCLEQFLHLIGWAAVDPNLDIMAWMLFLDYVCLAATTFLCISHEKS